MVEYRSNDTILAEQDILFKIGNFGSSFPCKYFKILKSDFIQLNLINFALGLECGIFLFLGLANDYMKVWSLQAVTLIVLSYSCTIWILMKSLEKKLDGNCKRILHAVLNKSWEQHPNKSEVVWPLTSHLINHPFKTNKIYRTLLVK